MKYCVAENGFLGGKTIAIELDGTDYFLMGAPKDGTLLVTETNLSLSQLRKIGGALCAMFDADRIKAYLPDYSCSEGEIIVSSVTFNAPSWNTYVNLLLI